MEGYVTASRTCRPSTGRADGTPARTRRTVNVERALFAAVFIWAATWFAIAPASASADYPSVILADHPVSYCA